MLRDITADSIAPNFGSGNLTCVDLIAVYNDAAHTGPNL